MTGYHSSEGYTFKPLDDRDEDQPEYSIDPLLSSPDFDFSSGDPAIDPIDEPSPNPMTFDPREEAH